MSFDPDCTLCPRLAEFLAAGKREYPQYHCAPVAPFGDADARLLIVGLAPGFHGANATGRPFTGDYAGILLYETLHAFGWSTAPVSVAADDGLRLLGCRISNSVKCVPPGNKPLPAEIATCNRYLAAELAALADGTVLLALGAIAHGAVLRALGCRLSAHAFAHGAEHRAAARPAHGRLVPLQPLQHQHAAPDPRDVPRGRGAGHGAGAGPGRLSFDLPVVPEGLALAARRVPHARRRRRDPLRRQGAAPAQSRDELLPRPRARRQDPGDGRAGGERRGHRDGVGNRGAAARVQPDQAAQAALQHPAQGRQELPVHPCLRPRVPAHRVLSRHAQAARAVLRALSQQVAARETPAAAAEAVPAAPLRGHLLRQPLAPLPAVPDQPLHRALRRPRHAGAVRAGRRRRDQGARWPQHRGDRRPRPPHGAPRRRSCSTSRRRGCATRSAC